RLFQNNNAVFTEVQTFLPEMGYGSSVWGDYDGDGFLDLLCNGLNTGDTDFKYQLFKNNAGASFTLVNSYSYNQLSTGDGGRFFDFDNDGDLDFVVTGYTGTREATAVYINTLGVFTEYAGNATLPGFAASSIEVGDVDNDTDLDLFLTGFSANDFDGALTTGPYNNKTSLLLKNLTAVVNVAPAAPTNLSVTGNQSALTITWNAATDLSPFQPANSLSYNLFVVDAAGKWFYYPLADTATGKLRLQRLGNVNLNKGWIIKGLPAGTYRCGVQAIDNSFMGSPFAKTTFTITEQGTLPVVLSAFLVKTEGKKAKIEWNTATEQNNDYFEIERSANGTDFYKLAAVKGSGNANNANSYSVYDNNPSKGKNYYRLIQYNKDGRITNHGVRTAIFDLNSLASVVLYPNPARNVFGIRLSNYESKLLNITVTDLSGKVVHRELLKTDNGQGYYNLNMKRKPASGQYILRVDGQDLKQSLKMIVQ
ncbi:MAG TPA: FG-GAP-like repeat-containing protein, partial [Segetibacter sp.]